MRQMRRLSATVIKRIVQRGSGRCLFIGMCTTSTTSGLLPGGNQNVGSCETRVRMLHDCFPSRDSLRVMCDSATAALSGGGLGRSVSSTRSYHRVCFFPRPLTCKACINCYRCFQSSWARSWAQKTHSGRVVQKQTSRRDLCSWCDPLRLTHSGRHLLAATEPYTTAQGRLEASTSTMGRQSPRWQLWTDWNRLIPMWSHEPRGQAVFALSRKR